LVVVVGCRRRGRRKDCEERNEELKMACREKS
jgi:hypothetical protein